MTTKELYDKMTIGCCAGGQFTVTIEFRGKHYSCKSNDTMAYDCLRSHDGELVWYASEKQALLALWNECKRANNLK